jgi:hypothetical protein
MQTMKLLANITSEEADDWWDELDRRTTVAEESAKARLAMEFPISRFDLFNSGDSAKAVIYLETKVDRLAALEGDIEQRCRDIVAGSMFAAQLPFASAEIVLDSVEEMTERGDSFTTPFL